jgi:galactitol-specific phosphotransferase system IIB component
MSKKKCDNKELKKQVEQLENMVQTMKIQMKSTETSKEYKFNEEQMVEFTSLLCARFNELMLNSIQELEFSNDVVDIEVEDMTIVPTIDSSVIADEIENELSYPSDEKMVEMIQETIDEMESYGEQTIVYVIDEEDEY